MDLCVRVPDVYSCLKCIREGEPCSWFPKGQEPPNGEDDSEDKEDFEEAKGFQAPPSTERVDYGEGVWHRT